MITPFAFIKTEAAPLDPDAQAFITEAGITDPTQQGAINTLVEDLKAASIWTKMKAIYPFVGGTATSHKYNLKDPRDLDAAYRLNFVGTWTHSSTGATPSNAYADTFLDPSVVLPGFNMHVSNYSRTQNTSANGVQIGAYDGAEEINLYQYYAGIALKGGSSYVYPNRAAKFNEDNTWGFAINTLRANNDRELFFNGVSLDINTNVETLNPPSISFYLGASHWTSGANQYSPHQHAFDSIGEGLNSTEALALYTAVQAFQTTLGRGGLFLSQDAGNTASYPGTGTTLYDLSLNGFTGTLTNGVGFSTEVGGALTFDGVDDYVNTDVGIPGFKDKTLEAWVRLDNVSQTGGGVINLEYDSGNTFDTIVYNETGQGWGFGSDGFNRTAWSGVLETSTTEWVHIVATYQDYNFRMYRNGTLILTTTSFLALDYSTTDSRSLLGLRHTGGANAYLDGAIAESRIYSRALTGAEVLEKYNATKARFGL